MGRLRYVLLILVLLAAAIGAGAGSASADTSALNWGQQNPAQSPPGRTYAAMDYDSRRGRVVLVGGGSGCCTTYSDTWEWDAAHWSQVATSGPGGIGGAMAYDSARGVSVFFDGGRTWEWSGTGWLQRFPANSPSTRTWTAMAYDAARHVVVLFGGSGGGVDDGDTWTYDGTNWTRMSPLSSPSARFGTALAFDSSHNVVVLFGGRASGQRMNDTWTWNGSNWTRLTPGTIPYPRFWHSMSYDAQLGETVMFGGDHIEPFGLGPENDTWLWDGTNWTRDWPSTAPIYRAGQTMAFDATTGRTVLFGGTDELQPGTYYGDTWELGSGIATPAGTPRLFFNPPAVWFGTPAIGTTTTPTYILVLNTGTGPMTISSISTTGDFAVSGTDCPVSPFPLAANEYCRVQVTYSPTVCATAIGSLIFGDRGPGGAQSMTLQGGVLQAGCDADLGLIQQRNIPAVNATSPSGAVVNFQNPLVFDEEATPSPITCDHPSGSMFPIGTTIVSCSVTDSDDVTSTVTTTFPVTVNDTDLALTGVPSDITTDAASSSGTVVNYSPPTALDEDSPTPSVTCVPASGSLFPIGITRVICTASDPDDTPSSVTATFRVSVGDGDLSLVNMPADVTVQATGPSGAAVGFVMPSSTDEDGSSPSVTCDHLSGSLFPLGTTTVTCTATDPDDTPSTVSATFKVTVIDTDLGLEGVSQDITVSATGPSGAIVTYVAPTGVDEDGEDLVVTCDHASGATYPIGTTTVTCSVSDEDDTPSTRRASFNITVNDTDLALTNVPADITAVATGASGAAVSFTPPTVIDEDADKPAVTCNRDSGSMFAVGTTTVTCSASDPDDSPSTVTASFHVTVIPDVRLAITVSPVTATAHSTVTTTVAATNIGNATEKVTITYSVAYVDASGAMSIVTSDKAQVTVSPGQTANRTFSFAVKNTTAKGAYVVTVTASDVTGTGTQVESFGVT